MSQNNEKIVKLSLNVSTLTTSLLYNFIKIIELYYYVISMSFLETLRVSHFNKLNIINFLNQFLNFCNKYKVIS